MKRRRIVVAMHSGLMPPESSEGMTAAELHPVKQEYDVCVTLEELGHDVLRVGVDDELAPLRRALISSAHQTGRVHTGGEALANANCGLVRRCSPRCSLSVTTSRLAFRVLR